MTNDPERVTGRQHAGRRRGIYLLPNLFTTGALFAGFFAVISAFKGHFTAAVLAMYLAIILDGLDGRVARLTDTASDFGKEYDSLSDCIVFGIAAALVLYLWSLQYLGSFGWLAAFLYLACTALRLARFNTQPLSDRSNYFRGLPCPAAAGLTMGFVWMIHDLDLSGEQLALPAIVLTLAGAGLMVSNMRYYSFKEFKGVERVPFTHVLALVMVFVLIALNPPVVLFLGFLVYALSGPLLVLQRGLGKRRLN